MKYTSLALLLVVCGIFFYVAQDLPKLGDASSPAATHVSPRYIEKSMEETATPNFVTSVLADYRGFDTLGETFVILTAGLSCLLILGLGLDE